MDTILQVACYAGYRGDERPVRFVLAGRTFDVATVEDKWYSPGATYFRVVVADGDRYVLRHDEAQDVWRLEGFRSSRGRIELGPEPHDPEASGAIN
jgi:hypothetical protein